MLLVCSVGAGEYASPGRAGTKANGGSKGESQAVASGADRRARARREPVFGLTAGGAAQGAKKKRGNKAKTFQNGTQFLIPDDPPGAGFPGQLDATIRVGRVMKGKEVADANVSIRITHPAPATWTSF